MYIDFNDLVVAVRDADKQRDVETLSRRYLKITEELGELAEAYLGVTSINNTKNKTWEDVREEATDVLIMFLDCALTECTTPFGICTTQITTDFLASLMTLGQNQSDGVIETTIMDDIFAFQGAVRSAYHALDSGFVSASVMTMISMIPMSTALAMAAYSQEDSDADADHIDEAFYDMFQRKIKKWLSGASTSMIAKDI